MNLRPTLQVDGRTVLPFLADDGSGVSHFWVNNSDGSYTIVSQQDVQPILDENAREYTANDGYTPSREMRRVGSIPMSLLHLWKTVEGWDPLRRENAQRLRRKLDDIDYLKLRTAPGRLGQIRKMI